MKTNLVRNLVATTSLLAGLGGAPSALATVVVETLGAGAGATDRYTVTCTQGAAFQLAGTVTDLFPVAGPLVSMQFTTGTSGAINTTDFIDGPQVNPVASTEVRLIGAGPFTVLVNKTLGGAEDYSMNIECRTALNAPLATTVVLNQDQ